ncbi:conserved hypothetical protein [Neospora caninum Liverpool]|uniref:C1orf124 protein n=1 Tax=Neospora caninum (strain Liverpool) TaxID=572307 RepID=F0VQ81_NEOCL|nr:conserved hypothetical protein [Neospora caninum Liverpool]CBZ55878.1 conserved hypothetical protein [Neospora caninum Liverpool]CEL70621.1 TPA: C1orf124 protein [Neospora caninum Liverpool]|eukprot:XP_003885904.1 conserved hypothetical protein [Neospora caninum Liverpool]
MDESRVSHRRASRVPEVGASAAEISELGTGERTEEKSDQDSEVEAVAVIKRRRIAGLSGGRFRDCFPKEEIPHQTPHQPDSSPSSSEGSDSVHGNGARAHVSQPGSPPCSFAAGRMDDKTPPGELFSGALSSSSSSSSSPSSSSSLYSASSSFPSSPSSSSSSSSCSSSSSLPSSSSSREVNLASLSIDGQAELVAPDLHALFAYYNDAFFEGKLSGVEVRWSKRMTLCAGLCVYQTGGYCSVRLSEPLLKFRSVKEFRETLLHEMIHAFLFVSKRNRDHDAHGPDFLAHMRRLNALTGLNITVFHNFHDEVAHYRTHIWRCQGKCRETPPFFGYVRRSMNRAPGPNDRWWAEHQQNCGGTYVKISEPKKAVANRTSSLSMRKQKKVEKDESVGSRNLLVPSGTEGARPAGSLLFRRTARDSASQAEVGETKLLSPRGHPRPAPQESRSRYPTLADVLNRNRVDRFRNLKTLADSKGSLSAVTPSQSASSSSPSVSASFPSLPSSSDSSLGLCSSFPSSSLNSPSPSRLPPPLHVSSCASSSSSCASYTSSSAFSGSAADDGILREDDAVEVIAIRPACPLSSRTAPSARARLSDLSRSRAHRGSPAGEPGERGGDLLEVHGDTDANMQRRANALSETSADDDSDILFISSTRGVPPRSQSSAVPSSSLKRDLVASELSARENKVPQRRPLPSASLSFVPSSSPAACPPSSSKACPSHLSTGRGAGDTVRDTPRSSSVTREPDASSCRFCERSFADPRALRRHIQCCLRDPDRLQGRTDLASVPRDEGQRVGGSDRC